MCCTHFKMPRLIIILFFFIALFDAFCGQKPKGKAFKETLVNKTVDSLLRDPVLLDSIPIKALGWTNDYEHIFSIDQISELDSIISAFEKETTNEIAIVTIERSLISKESFDSLTLAIAKNWGVGKKAKNNGVLIGISTGLRMIRIQNGYGIEAKLTNAETKKIIDDIILPEFKKGDYFKGTKSGLLALMQKIR